MDGGAKPSSSDKSTKSGDEGFARRDKCPTYVNNYVLRREVRGSVRRLITVTFSLRGLGL